MAILFTAGTSTKYKGVVQSHESLLWTAEATAAGLEMTDSDRTLCTVPLFNIFGLGVALITSIVTGSGLVLQESFEVTGLLELIESERPTVLHGVPTMFVMMLRDPAIESADLSSLRTGVIAGAPVSAELANEVRARIVPDLEIAYGLTETAPTVSMTLPTDSPEKRAGTVGRPLPGVEVHILDEAELRLPAGTEGEVAVRGFNLMSGYFRQPATTRNAMTQDGLFKTGDLGSLDDEGYLHIDGRKRDLIIRGGYSVHPREVEDHLRSLPAVADAAVVGIPNEVLGELVCACVVLIEGALVTEVEIRELCRPTLAEYKLPDVVHFVEELPKTTTGRSRRAEISRRMRLELAARRQRTGQLIRRRDSSYHPLPGRTPGGEVEGPLARLNGGLCRTQQSSRREDMNEIYSRAPHRPAAPADAPSPHAALLIDFDNVTMGIRSNLGQELSKLLDSDIIRGKVSVQRAYADWRRYPQYIASLSEASIDLIFAPAYGSTKKNATDIRLAIDALEIVFIRPEIGTFILLSGDSDFSSLVLKLKEYGKYVIGVGIQESSVRPARPELRRVLQLQHAIGSHLRFRHAEHREARSLGTVREGDPPNDRARGCHALGPVQAGHAGTRPQLQREVDRLQQVQPLPYRVGLAGHSGSAQGCQRSV